MSQAFFAESLNIARKVDSIGCKVRRRVSALLLFCCFNVDDVTKRREWLDPTLEDVAASLRLASSHISSFASRSPASVGDLRWRTFARPAFAVGIRALRDGSLDTLTIAIFDQFQSTFNGPAANTPAGILALLCLAPLGRGRYLRLALAARENHDG